MGGGGVSVVDAGLSIEYVVASCLTGLGIAGGVMARGG